MGHRAGFQYNFLRLNLECPWNLYGATVATYSNNFVLSGAAPLADNEAEPTALDLFEPIKKLSRATAYLKSWSYYHPNVGTAAVHMEYTPSQHPCDASAYTDTGGHPQQSEVCILCEGPTDKNSRGKQVYLRKFIHDVMALPSDVNSHYTLAAGDPLIKWKNGSGPRLLVPIDADSGTQASTWTIQQHLYTRQFRKGKKRKAPAISTVQEVIDIAEKLAPLLPLIPK